MQTNKRNKRRGNTLVESALTILPFMAIMIGVVDLGQVILFHQSLVDRVRAGLRYGVTHEFDEAAIRNVVRFHSPVPAAGATPFFGLSESHVTINRYDVGTSTERLRVAIVNYPYHFFSPWIAKTFTNNMAVVETLPNEYRE